MQYTGLAKKYTVNRPLTDQERERQLKQGERLDLEPAYQLSVIRLNSTYMELVDKFFAWKGFLTTFVVIAAAILCGGFSYLSVNLALDAIRNPSETELWFHSIGMFLVAALATIPLYWAFRKEAFAWTHYPIRMNRKTRMVHVFRTDGTVLSVPWDEVFFCIGALPQFDLEIQGHVLDSDRVTVRETFPLAFYTVKSDISTLERYWEFVRRYMEEGPQDAAKRVEFFMVPSNRRESIAGGFHRVHAELGTNVFLSLIGAVLAAIMIPGRWLAMRTSKLPVWPDEIESQCRIEANDPYIRDARDNPADLR